MPTYITEQIKDLRYVSIEENGVLKKKLFFKPRDQEEYIEVDLSSLDNNIDVINTVGVLERPKSVVSGPFSALEAWRSSLKTVRDGGLARVLAIGDSTTGGWASSYVDRAASQWGAFRINGCRPGLIFMTNTVIHPDSRVTYGTGWIIAGAGAMGPANQGVAQGEPSGAGTLDIGPISCDRFEIFFLDGGVSSFDYWIDGGAHTTVSVGATATSRSVVTTPVSPGNHTLHIGNVVGAHVYVYAVEPRLGVSGLYVGQAGLGGTYSTQWASGGSSLESSALMFDGLNPNLTIIMLTVGDLVNAVPLATYRNNIDFLVAKGQETGSVLLVAAPRPTISSVITYDQYVLELEGVRDDRSCGLLNLARHFDYLPSSLYMDDTLHPSVDAQGEMALVLSAVLMP